MGSEKPSTVGTDSEDTVELVSVAAVAENGVIGRGGELPWESIPADKAQYRDLIADDAVILGRHTFESMREDLPGRTQIVLSRTEREYGVETAVHAGSVDGAVDRVRSFESDLAYVIGGGGIYDLFQPHVDRMVLSRVHGRYEGDTYYPEWNEDDWKQTDETVYGRFTLEGWRRR